MNARRRRPSATAIVMTAVGGVVVAIVLVATVLNLATDPDVDVNLGDDIFELGRASRFAEEIEEDGPLLFQALAGGRDIYVQHVGTKAREGWLAFLAYPDNRRDCQLKWRRQSEDFVDCDGKVYPADGEGLTQFLTDVDSDGVVTVDLRTEVTD